MIISRSGHSSRISWLPKNFHLVDFTDYGKESRVCLGERCQVLGSRSLLDTNKWIHLKILSWWSYGFSLMDCVMALMTGCDMGGVWHALLYSASGQPICAHIRSHCLLIDLIQLTKGVISQTGRCCHEVATRWSITRAIERHHSTIAKPKLKVWNPCESPGVHL